MTSPRKSVSSAADCVTAKQWEWSWRPRHHAGSINMTDYTCTALYRALNWVRVETHVATVSALWAARLSVCSDGSLDRYSVLLSGFDYFSMEQVLEARMEPNRTKRTQFSLRGGVKSSFKYDRKPDYIQCPCRHPIGFSARRGSRWRNFASSTMLRWKWPTASFPTSGPAVARSVTAYYQRYWHYNARGKCPCTPVLDLAHTFVFGGERAEEFSWRLRGESYMSIMERGGGIVSTVKATRACNFIQLRSKAESWSRWVLWEWLP